MGDLSEMCHTIRSRARMAVAKASVCPHSELSFVIFPPVNMVFIFRSENIRDHFPATVTSGPTTGIKEK